MDSYAHYLVLLAMVVSVAWLYWLISRPPQPLPAHVTNYCTRCGRSLDRSPDHCLQCGMEIDSDDRIAAPLEMALLEQDWPSTRVTQRIPEPAEEAITIHTTVNPREASRLQEQLAARGYACRMDTVEPEPAPAPAHMRAPSGPNSPQPVPAPLPILNIKVYTEDLAAARHYVRGLRRAARLKTFSPG